MSSFEVSLVSSLTSVAACGKVGIWRCHPAVTRPIAARRTPVSAPDLRPDGARENPSGVSDEAIGVHESKPSGSDSLVFRVPRSIKDPVAHVQCLFELLGSLGVVHLGVGPDSVFELLEFVLVSALRSVYVLL